MGRRRFWSSAVGSSAVGSSAVGPPALGLNKSVSCHVSPQSTLRLITPTTNITNIVMLWRCTAIPSRTAVSVIYNQLILPGGGVGGSSQTWFGWAHDRSKDIFNSFATCIHGNVTRQYNTTSATGFARPAQVGNQDARPPHAAAMVLMDIGIKPRNHLSGTRALSASIVFGERLAPKDRLVRVFARLGCVLVSYGNGARLELQDIPKTVDLWDWNPILFGWCDAYYTVSAPWVELVVKEIESLYNCVSQRPPFALEVRTPLYLPDTSVVEYPDIIIDVNRPERRPR